MPAEHDLTGWWEGLAYRPDVTIHVHDVGNHLFSPGSGPSIPADYRAAQRADPAIIADIADWLVPGQGRD